MTTQLSQMAPLAESKGEISPCHLWANLTISQQQRLRQILITIAQHWLTMLSDAPMSEEQLDEYPCEAELPPNYPLTSGTQSCDLHSSVEP